MLPATPRLRLRRFRAGDAKLLHDLDADPEVTRYTLRSQGSMEHYAECIAQYLAQYAESGGRLGYFAATARWDGEFIGWFHLKPAAGLPGALDLGYRLRRSAWGRGLATEMSRALIAYAFREIGTRRVVATALAANAASVRVMEKCGMVRAKDFLYREPGGAAYPAVRCVIDAPES